MPDAMIKKDLPRNLAGEIKKGGTLYEFPCLRIRMKEFSKYNIFTKIKDSENHLIMNLLSGNADILDADEAKYIESHTFGDSQYYEEYISKGYLVDPEEEDRHYRQRYLDFLDLRDSSEIQIFFVPNYSCNFSCSYCYQDQYEWKETEVNKDLIEAFYRYIDSEFKGKDKYITIFGGEPLLPSPGARNTVDMLIEGATERNLDVAVVTNGYNLKEYIDILHKASIREIQVTLDGTRDVHDKRRPLKNGGGTFDKIAEGVDAALSAKMAVNLRVVLDKENIAGLPELVKYASEKGWTDDPLFKTQLGRNYELHHCQSKSAALYSRKELYEDLYDIILQYPEIVEFHRPAYSVSRFLFENGELPEPLFDSCPGCKTEWAFDYTGHIYSCTATVGKKDESLGTFYPSFTKKEDAIEIWEERDVTAIEECRHCPSQHLCGGGCAAVAKNNRGDILAPDCRPVHELVSMGISLYFEKEICHVKKDKIHKCC